MEAEKKLVAKEEELKANEVELVAKVEELEKAHTEVAQLGGELTRLREYGPIVEGTGGPGKDRYGSGGL